jgi:predicted RNA-binding protein
MTAVVRRAPAAASPERPDVLAGRRKKQKKQQRNSVLSCGRYLFMCQQNAYVIRNDQKNMIMESVVKVEAEGEDVRLVSVFGEQKTVHGIIHALALNDGEILLKET